MTRGKDIKIFAAALAAAFLFFLCDQLLAAVLGLDLLAFIYPTATAFSVALGAAINVAVWAALAYLLNKKKIHLKI